MHVDQLIFILLIALAGLFRLLTSKTTTRPDQGEPPRRSTTPPPTNDSPPADSDQERIRRFLEALGQPTSSTPPPPVLPRTLERPKPTALPHVGPMRSPLPPLKTRPPDLPKERPPTLPHQVTVAKPPPVTIPPVELPAFEVHTALSAEPPVEVRAETGESATDLAQLLGSISALRNAVILREVFGPPRGLQQFDLIGN
jgi:hypothetical protein